MSTSPVLLHIYDLSQGMARQFSPAILGKSIDGIWHTGVVVFGYEYYFGGGICYDPPLCTPYGNPKETIELGRTSKTKVEFFDFLVSISTRFSMRNYHVLDNNCNNFSDVCCKFLLGESAEIPRYIIDLPNEAINSPLGPMLRPLLENMQSVIRDQSLGHEVELAGSSLPFDPRNAQSKYASASDSTPKIDGANPGEQVFFTRANRTVVMMKLKEFDPFFVEDEENNVRALLRSEARLAAEIAFPALDLLRLGALVDEQSCVHVAEVTPRFLQKYVLDHSAPRSCRLMTLRLAANCFKHPCGAKVLCAAESIEILVEALAESLSHEHASIPKTAGALAFNLTDAPQRFPEHVAKLSEDDAVRVTWALVERANNQLVASTPDEAFPLLGALVNLVENHEGVCDLLRTLDLDLSRYIDENICTDDRTRKLATLIHNLVN